MVQQAVERFGPQVLQNRIRGSVEEFRAGIPLGRLGTPDEQAALIEFVLLSATFMTGAAVFSDGGVTVL
jgi:NAD(P)-dependent dehydrogenase (short-subunit alcohol dehydrogenase family)